MTQLVEYSPVLSWAIDITAALILLGVLCAFVRLVKGPTLPDRVVSVGVISVLAVAIAGLVAIAIAEVTALDVAFAGALVSFLATVAFAWYADQRTDQLAERRRTRNGEED